MSRWLKAIVVGLTTGLIGSLIGLTPLGHEFEQDFGLAWLFRTRGPIAAPAEVAIVAIDFNSAAKLTEILPGYGTQNRLNPLPRDWPRSVHAKLLDGLTRLGASVVVFDMDFNRAKDEHDDRVFADAIARSGRVILFERLTGKRQPLVGKDGKSQGWLWVEQSVPALPMFADAARGSGPFPLPKLDEALYQFWAFKPSAGGSATMPAMALQFLALRDYEMWRDLLVAAGVAGKDQLPISADDFSRRGQLQEFMLQIRQALLNNPAIAPTLNAWLESDQALDLPLDRRRMLKALIELYAGEVNRFLNFYGPPGTVRTVPYHRVAAVGQGNGSADGLNLAGKVVFVGFADLHDPGQPDRFYTVFTGEDGVDLSGVEIAATAFANLLTHNTVGLASSALIALCLLVFGLIIGTVAYRFPAHYAVPVAALLALSYAIAVQSTFNQTGYWLPLAVPMLVQVPLALLMGLLGQYLLERREKQRFSEAVSYYLPENVARELVEKGVKPDEANKVVYAVCLATDMAGFTTLGESMQAGELATFMNDYFEALAEPLQRNGVDVTEFRADAIMCAWTSESELSDIHFKAASAALDAVYAVSIFSQKQRRELIPRIGLDAGWVYVGHAGGGGHFVYSIVGDSANTAARVEGLNKKLGTSILATESVVEGLDALLLRRLGHFVFVGKQVATSVFEIVAYRESATTQQLELCERFHEALAVFESERWQHAEQLFERVLEDYSNDRPSALYRDRCREYAARPPEFQPRTVILLDKK
jgi:adenylate cyclase